MPSHTVFWKHFKIESRLIQYNTYSGFNSFVVIISAANLEVKSVAPEVPWSFFSAYVYKMNEVFSLGIGPLIGVPLRPS